MKELERFSRLVADLYDAAAGNASFAPLGQRIAAALDSGSCAFNVLNGKAGHIEALSWTDNCAEMLPMYGAYYHQHDVWAEGGARQAPGQMVATQEFITDEAFRRTEFYQDCCKRFGLFRALGAVIPLHGANGAVGMVSIHRGEAEHSFGQDTIRRGTLLVPHIQRALQLRERLAALEIGKRSLSQATAALNTAVFAVSADARIVFANPSAETLIGRDKPLCLENGRLAARRPAETEELRRAIQIAAEIVFGKGRIGTGVIRIARAHARPLQLFVYPFPEMPGSGLKTLPMALIFAADPDAAPYPKREVLARVYGITGAEAKLFEALLIGDTIQEYAKKAGISVQTAKTQLAHIFRRTGHSRQIDLVRDALTNPALRMASL